MANGNEATAEELGCRVAIHRLWPEGKAVRIWARSWASDLARARVPIWLQSRRQGTSPQRVNVDALVHLAADSAALRSRMSRRPRMTSLSKRTLAKPTPRELNENVCGSCRTVTYEQLMPRTCAIMAERSLNAHHAYPRKSAEETYCPKFWHGRGRATWLAHDCYHGSNPSHQSTSLQRV